MNNFISDHRPIILKWTHGDLGHGIPFKFNRVWLEDPKFGALVRDVWYMDKERDISPMVNILEKLRALKVEVKTWERRKSTQMKKDLKDIYVALDSLSPQLLMHNPPGALRDNIHSLELKRKHILQIRETTWHLKSRAIWIQEGDRNTNFFHRFSNHRRKINSIWEITDAEGNMV